MGSSVGPCGVTKNKKPLHLVVLRVRYVCVCFGRLGLEVASAPACGVARSPGSRSCAPPAACSAFRCVCWEMFVCDLSPCFVALSPPNPWNWSDTRGLLITGPYREVLPWNTECGSAVPWGLWPPHGAGIRGWTPSSRDGGGCRWVRRHAARFRDAWLDERTCGERGPPSSRPAHGSFQRAHLCSVLPNNGVEGREGAS